MASSRIDLLLRIVDEAFRRKAWHGTTLRGSLTGVDPAAATARPAAQRHNVAELALHTAYWKYTVRRRLTGEKRGSFPRKGSNWFPVASLDLAGWKEIIQLLEREHDAMLDVIRGLRDAALDGKPPNGGIWTVSQIVSGIAAHDLYHTGQIQLVKRLLR